MTQTSTAGRLNNQSGFTLIELALVVVILGLLAGLSLPMLSSLEPNRLNSTARRLAGTVKYLYNEAVMSGTEHRLIFDLAGNSYHAMQVEPSGELQPLGNQGRRYQLPDNVRLESVFQPRRGEYRDGQMTTTLRPEGWLEETIIHLADANQHKLTLRLVPLTGLTEIYEGYKDFR
mgnify:CR=1 FL=1